MKAQAKRCGPRAAMTVMAVAAALAGCGRGAPARDWEPASAVESPEQKAAPDRPSRPQDLPQFRADPTLFQVEEETLWDGRPSLGGAWAAHPSVEGQMMVEAVNLDDGHRIRLPALRLLHRPGRPTLQLSAEAARALALRPGEPTRVRLTALVRDGSQALAAAAAPEPGEAAEAPSAAPPAAAPSPAPVETFAVEPAAAPEPASEPAPEAPAIADVAAAAPAQQQTRNTTQPEALAPAPDESPADDARPEAPRSIAALPAARPAATVRPPATSAARPAEARPAEAQPASRPAAAQAEAAPAAASPATPPATPVSASTADSGPSAPYVQVGAFGQPGNAERTAARFRDLGQPVGLVAAGRLMRVVLGPFDRIEDAAAALEIARAQGFADAYIAAR